MPGRVCSAEDRDTSITLAATTRVVSAAAKEPPLSRTKRSAEEDVPEEVAS